MTEYKNIDPKEVAALLKAAKQREENARKAHAEAEAEVRHYKGVQLCQSLGIWPGDMVECKGKTYRVGGPDPRYVSSWLMGYLVKKDGTESDNPTTLHNAVTLVKSA